MESRPARSARFGLVVGLVVLVLGAAAAAPAPEARLVLNSDRYVVGSRWTLDILVDTADPLTVKVTWPSLPPALALSDGPQIRETSWERVPGTLSRATKVSFAFRVLSPGIVELGPFDLKIGSTVRSVPAVTLFLLAADEAKHRFPVEVGWVKPTGPFYVGQALPLLLQAKNLDSLAQPDDVGLAASGGFLVEKAVGLGEIEINSIGEDRLMNVPWGGWMLLPTRPGTLTVPALKVSVGGLIRTASPFTLDVLPLPSDLGGSRAVGEFSYNVEARAGDAGQGSQLVVTQELSGRGNFPYLVLPPVSVEGLTLVSRQEGTRYRAGRQGYEGSLLVTWRFAAEQAKTVALVLPGFQAYQPATGRVDLWEPKAVSVALTLPAVQAGPPAPVARPLDWAGVVAARPWGQNGPWGLLLFLPGPLVLLTSFFVGRGRKGRLLVLLPLALLSLSAQDSEPAGFAAALAAPGTQALGLWQGLTRDHPDEPGLWYNQALAAQDAGQAALAVHGFRMALHTGFQGDRAARGLAALEATELLNDQFVPWGGWTTNTLWAVLAVLWNLTLVLWGLQRLTGSAVLLLPLALGILAAAGTGVVLVSAEATRTEADAVIGTADSPIRKVPGDMAEAWMSLKAGTVVRVLGSSERWRLVQTGYGLEGWVSQAALLPLEVRR